ncbi:MAG: type IV toxin-antitoxin system AbiEi family antitoxin domain-containing protein [Halioglobus sp.]|nr:type IV toxin-antitoxin system AbiEi family antitoxin domain-containing protein [Halioglobus sp.]
MKLSSYSALLALILAFPAFGAGNILEAGKDYRISIPEDWTEIPREALLQYQEIVSKTVGQKLTYEYGYQSLQTENWFEYPYVLIQVIRSGRIPEGQLKDYKKIDSGMEEGLEKVSKAVGSFLSNASVGETIYDSSIHVLWSRMAMDVDGAGTVNSLIGLKLTEYGYIQFMGYALANEFASYEPIYRKMIQSISLSEEDTYNPRLTDNAPTVFGINLGQTAIAAIVGALMAGLFGLARKLWKKTPDDAGCRIPHRADQPRTETESRMLGRGGGPGRYGLDSVTLDGTRGFRQHVTRYKYMGTICLIVMADSDSPVSASNEAVALFRAHGGQLRLSEALKLGLNRYRFYKLRDEGTIEPISRGLYRLTELPPVRHPDLVAVASRFPRAVLCLISALDWHEMTTQVPRAIDLAVARNARLPSQDYPPVRGYRFSAKRFNSGVELHEIDGVTLRVYCAEKTLADCFAFRGKIGMDVVLEALKLYPKRYRPQYDKLLEYARLCRVEKLMRPYLEASLP